MDYRNYLTKQAEENFEYALSSIDRKIKNIYLSKDICNMWMFGDLEREYKNKVENTTPYFPISIFLKLSPTDDICTEGMLFIEEIESKYSISISDSHKIFDDELKAFSYQDIYIHFMPHAEGRCRIVKDIHESFEKITNVKEKIVCL